MKKFGFLLMALLLAFVVAACGAEESSSESVEETTDAEVETAGEEEVSSEPVAEEDVIITHELGEIKVPKNPENVVVFDFGVLDSLDKLGVEVAGVPQAGVIPSYLSKYAESTYENIGSLKEPDFEKISEINPGLIIITARQSEAYEELSKIAPTLYMNVDTADYMNSFTANMETLGEIFGKEAEVETELAAINETIEALQEKAAASGEKGLIVLVNDGSVSAYGSNSRYGIIHDVFGVQAADENIEVSTHGQNVSFEYISEMNPDLLFVIDRGAAIGGESSAATVLDNELVNKTNAAQNDKIIYLDAEFWYLSGGGLVSVVEMVNQIDGVIE
ncbi:siderophore ABC transporter substrate-binding protein [Halalkalibacter urbisdiaboli]|uniref:siderophore ABC transporter substrate-binding protein n=1 Tax=Halalkalibacter urbisdiaboli TaxID=1960589 RepID=UPI000B448916|nr:siderophore ABC transporter substrate-binding protein [Halalkalibacter urbisdiaboli]